MISAGLVLTKICGTTGGFCLLGGTAVRTVSKLCPAGIDLKARGSIAVG